MNGHVQFALAHPVFDPSTQIVPGHFWFVDRFVSMGLTVNLGLE